MFILSSLQWFKKELESRLFSHPAFSIDIKAAVSDSVAAIEQDLLQDPSVDTNFSGTTLVLVVIRGHSITIANIGDSRITLGSKRHVQIDETIENSHLPSSMLEAIPLSVDHKPSIQSEKERILKSGGRVFSVEYEDGTKGPERVWLSHMNIPGLKIYSLFQFLLSNFYLSSNFIIRFNLLFLTPNFFQG